MQPVVPSSFRQEFARRAAWRRDHERLVRDDLKRKEDEDRKRGRDNDEQHDALIEFIAVVLATDAQIDSFAFEVDRYETATVDALQENERQLKAVNEQLEELLTQAYVLPDGRRVFKTEDGTQVFDEFGKEIDASLIDPDMIEDWRPSWQRYEGPFKARFEMMEERDELLEFQQLTDEVDAEIEEAKRSGGMRSDRLEELKEKLAGAAPDAVKRRVDPNYEATAAQNKSTSEIGQGVDLKTAVKLDMPAL
jgi:hypothetical protein